MNDKSITAKKSFDFAIAIIKLCKKLRSENEYILANQLLRCGTSIGANIEEARAAQSRKDFISKMYIALKEARETRYWLLLINVADIGHIDTKRYLFMTNELIRLLTSSIKTAKENA